MTYWPPSAYLYPDLIYHIYNDQNHFTYHTKPSLLEHNNNIMSGFTDSDNIKWSTIVITERVYTTRISLATERPIIWFFVKYNIIYTRIFIEIYSWRMFCLNNVYTYNIIIILNNYHGQWLWREPMWRCDIRFRRTWVIISNCGAHAHTHTNIVAYSVIIRKSHRPSSIKSSSRATTWLQQLFLVIMNFN